MTSSLTNSDPAARQASRRPALKPGSGGHSQLTKHQVTLDTRLAALPSVNGLAVASMVLGIVWIYWVGSVLAIIFGHIALSQIRKNPNLRGRGMAIAGVVLGYVGMAVFALGMLALAASW